MPEMNFSIQDQNLSLNRGEVYYVFPSANTPTVGSEQRSGRPAVIVSNDMNNVNSPCVEMCYLTLKVKRDLPTHVKIDYGPCVGSTVLCEQVVTVSREHLGEYLCNLEDFTMVEVDKALVISLGLEYLFDKETQIKELKYHLERTESELAVAKEANKTIKEKAAKAVIYERMYNDLLDRLTRR